MIVFRVNLICDGCSDTFGAFFTHELITRLANLAATLEELAIATGWTEQNGRHWCKRCAERHRQSKAAAV